MSEPRARIVIIGGGPGGYEAALVAAQLGAQVTVVDRDGLGGACVLTDCVPSKTLIATSGMMAALDGAAGLGIRVDCGHGESAADSAAIATVDAPRLYARVRALARAQSEDVTARLAAEGIEVVSGTGRLAAGTGGRVGPHTVEAGDVLYLALEDTPRRLKSRMQKLLQRQDAAAPERLHLACQWPRADRGGLPALAEWLDALAGAPPGNALYPLLPFLAERGTRARLTFFELFTQGPCPGFTSDAASAALAGTGVTCPPLDGALLTTYLDHFGRVGWLPAVPTPA